MNSLQLTRGQGRYKRQLGRKFANMRAAKERQRLNPQPIPDEPEFTSNPSKAKFATVSIACGHERVTFRVSRYDDRRLVMRGKAQAPSSIGKRIALALNAVLS